MSKYAENQSRVAKGFRRLRRFLLATFGRISGGKRRLPEEDFSMAVPFDFSVNATWSSGRRIASVCHIFYVDLAEEMLSYLNHLPVQTDLFISTTDDAKAIALRQVFSSWGRGRVDVRVAANQGRDIAPKLVTFREVYEAGYELILFLHSKKTEREDTGPAWRSALFQTLAGSVETVGSVLTLFDQNPRLGMVIPQHHESIRQHVGWQNNLLHGRRLARHMGFSLKTAYPLDFAAGSMFWLRPEAILPLLRLKLQIDDFPREGGQVGDTVAHGIERMMLYSCELAGYDWLKIADPRFFGYQDTIVPIHNLSELGPFAEAHGFSLLPSPLRGPHSRSIAAQR